MKKLISILITITMGLTSVTLAGGWVVGGGEIIEDAINPWFLQNTPIVKYCVLIDETHFGLSRSEAEKVVVQSLDFWKRQFKYQIEREKDFPVYNQQEFIKESCSHSTDLKFQFGYLDLNQMDKLQDIDRKIAVTVRTDYDRTQMRGTGFIYISPESGPLMIKHPRIINKPWSTSKGTLTTMALVHELGHVFGLRHQNDMSIMDERAVEHLVTNEFGPFDSMFFEYVLKNYYLFQIQGENGPLMSSICLASNEQNIIELPNPNPQNPVIKTKRILNGLKYTSQMMGVRARKYSNQQELTKEFFGLNFSPNCIGKSYGIKNGKYFLKLALSNNENESSEMVLISELEDELPLIRSEPVLEIYLPKEQVVIPYSANVKYRRFGYKIKSVSFKSQFNVNESGVKRAVVVTLYPNFDQTITSEFNGKVYLDILSGY